MSARRGEIWLIDFGEAVGREQAGIRPAVIVSSNLMNEGPSGLLIAVPCTTARRELPSHIEIDPERSGLDEVSYAKSEDVRSVPERRLVSRIGTTDVVELFLIGQAIGHLLDL